MGMNCLRLYHTLPYQCQNSWFLSKPTLGPGVCPLLATNDPAMHSTPFLAFIFRSSLIIEELVTVSTIPVAPFGYV